MACYGDFPAVTFPCPFSNVKFQFSNHPPIQIRNPEWHRTFYQKTCPQQTSQSTNCLSSPSILPSWGLAPSLTLSHSRHAEFLGCFLWHPSLPLQAHINIPLSCYCYSKCRTKASNLKIFKNRSHHNTMRKAWLLSQIVIDWPPPFPLTYKCSFNIHLEITDSSFYLFLRIVITLKIQRQNKSFSTN